MALRQEELTSIEDGRKRAGLTREGLKDLLHAAGIDCVQKTVDRWCITGRMRTDVYNAVATVINARLPEGEPRLPLLTLFVAPVTTTRYSHSRPWSALTVPVHV